jgi:hypothetical protein
MGLLVIILTGGEDFALSPASALRVSSGLGGAGDGRSRGELVDVGDLISKRRIADSLRVKVLLMICGEREPSLPVAMAMSATSYALFPRLLLTEEYVLSSASATRIESGELLFGGGSIFTCCSGRDLLATGFLGMTCAAALAIEDGTACSVCLHLGSLVSCSSSATDSGTLAGMLFTASKLASTLPTLNMVFRVSRLARGLSASRLVVRGNKPVCS